jgi:catechol 2,3-dioxygenase-like lactoylglutathione lyase family enzyme
VEIDVMNSSDEKPRFELVSPVFPVFDLPAALDFYREKLGFGLNWIWGEPPSHASVCRGNVMLMLTLHASKAGTGEVYIEVSGADAYAAELRSRDLVAGELADRAYGMRDFNVLDPSGNRLVFGEPLPGLKDGSC